MNNGLLCHYIYITYIHTYIHTCIYLKCTGVGAGCFGSTASVKKRGRGRGHRFGEDCGELQLLLRWIAHDLRGCGSPTHREQVVVDLHKTMPPVKYTNTCRLPPHSMYIYMYVGWVTWLWFLRYFCSVSLVLPAQWAVGLVDWTGRACSQGEGGGGRQPGDAASHHSWSGKIHVPTPLPDPPHPGRGNNKIPEIKPKI